MSQHTRFFGFCCRTCGTEGYCDHKLDVATNIFSINHDEDNDITRKELTELSMEERFTIFSDMVPPPSRIPPPPAAAMAMKSGFGMAPPESSYVSASSSDEEGGGACCFRIATHVAGGGYSKASSLAGTAATSAFDSSSSDDSSSCSDNSAADIAPPDGVDTDTDEDPDYIDDCLLKLDDELNNNVKPSEKIAYEQAKSISLEYVTSRSFLLSFLRAEQFNIKETAKRIIGHFDMKKELFCTTTNSNGGVDEQEGQEGDDDLSLLGRDIHKEDLNMNEQEILDNVWAPFRFLPEPDYGGRHVLFIRSGKLNYEDTQSQLRALWVLINETVKDNDKIQKVGINSIICMLDLYTKIANMDYDFIRKLTTVVFLRTPVRFNAVYCLLDGSPTGIMGSVIAKQHKKNAWNNVFEFMNFLVGKMIRLRSRAIRGSLQECKYNLMCLGFTPTSMPPELLTEDDNGGKKKRKNDANAGIKKRERAASAEIIET